MVVLKSVAGAVSRSRWVRILPILFLANLVNSIDKSVISYALPAGMQKDLGMTSGVSGLLGTVFYLGYLFLQIPGGTMASKGKAKKLLAFLMLGWSVLLVLTGRATTELQVFILRFLLGFCEGAMYPALVTMVASWFPNEERGRATSIYLVSGGAASVIVGPIASAVLSSYSWRILFYFAGGVSFVFLIIWIFFLSERPVDAKWLSEGEKNYILTKLEEDNAGKKEIQQASLASVLKERYTWKLSAIFFCTCMGVQGFAFWLPTIIKNITKTSMAQASLLSVIPSIVMICGTLIMGVVSDKTQKRRFLMGFSPIIYTALMLIAMLFQQSSGWLCFGLLTISTLFIQGSIPNMWAIVGKLFPAEMSGSARAVINICGNIGTMVAPTLLGFCVDFTGSMTMGWLFIFILSFVGFAVSLTMPRCLNGSAQKLAKAKEAV